MVGRGTDMKGLGGGENKIKMYFNFKTFKNTIVIKLLKKKDYSLSYIKIEDERLTVLIIFSHIRYTNPQT